MAEPFSIATGALQVASAGVKLATTLYTYSETVWNADKRIKAIASDVSITANVLRELGDLLEKDQSEKLCSANAISTADAALKGCKDAFDEVDEAIKGSLKPNGSGKKTLSVAARFAWPLKQNKMMTLGANLDRLKSTLLLMLNVLTYARKLSLTKYGCKTTLAKRTLTSYQTSPGRKRATSGQAADQ